MQQKTHVVSLQEVLRHAFGEPAEQRGHGGSVGTPVITAVPATRTSEDRSRMRHKVLEALARKRQHSQGTETHAPASTATAMTNANQAETSLFGGCGIGSAGDGAKRRGERSVVNPRAKCGPHADLRELVATAYRALMRRVPEDHVIADPIANAEFITRCHQLGATVSEAALNRTLLNNRKAKRHADILREPVIGLEPGLFDEIGYAVEIAASLVQREWFGAGYGLPSVDDILCGPELRDRFGTYVAALHKDVDVVSRHLVLLAYRKSGRESAQRLASVDAPDPLFTRPLRSLDPSEIPECCGIYRVLCKRKPIFVSSTANLRQRILKHLTVRNEGFLPGDVPFHIDGPVSFQVFAAPRGWLPRRAEAVARSMRIDEYPDLNWREKGALFSQQSHVVPRLAVVC